MFQFENRDLDTVAPAAVLAVIIKTFIAAGTIALAVYTLKSILAFCTVPDYAAVVTAVCEPYAVSKERV